MRFIEWATHLKFHRRRSNEPHAAPPKSSLSPDSLFNCRSEQTNGQSQCIENGSWLGLLHDLSLTFCSVTCSLAIKHQFPFSSFLVPNRKTFFCSFLTALFCSFGYFKIIIFCNLHCLFQFLTFFLLPQVGNYFLAFVVQISSISFAIFNHMVFLISSRIGVQNSNACLLIT